MPPAGIRPFIFILLGGSNMPKQETPRLNCHTPVLMGVEKSSKAFSKSAPTGNSHSPSAQFSFMNPKMLKCKVLAQSPTPMSPILCSFQDEKLDASHGGWD